MALIKCSECGNDVSDKADVCPHCGNPVSAVSKSQKGQALLSSKKIIIFLSLIALLVGVIVLVSMLLSNKWKDLDELFQMSKTELEASLKEMGIEVSELSYDNSICVITRSGKNEKAVEYIKKVSNLEIIGEIDRFCFEINNNIVSELVYLIDDADSFSDLCSRLGVDPDTNYKEEKESLGAKMGNKIYSGHVNLSRKYVLVIRYNADTGNGWGYITTNENAKINYPDSF